MKRDGGHRVQRLIMVATSATIISIGLLITTTVSADEGPALVANELTPESKEQVIVVSQAVTQPDVAAATVSLSGMAAAASSTGEDFEDDPFEGFNEKMFWFNREVLDRYLLKPLATGWDFILPDPVQRGVHNFFDNLAVVRRVVNNSLQLKLTGAGTELARFGINSTIGFVGFFDVAKDAFGIEQRDEDTGQTFGVWGMGPGPYLVLPLLPPLTIREPSAVNATDRSLPTFQVNARSTRHVRVSYSLTLASLLVAARYFPDGW